MVSRVIRLVSFTAVMLALVLLSAPLAFGTHINDQDGRTNLRTWRMAPSFPSAWDTALSNGATMWDNVLNQCHDFQQITSTGEHTLLYKVDNYDGKFGVFALTWANHAGIAFDGAEVWHANVNSSPPINALDLWSVAGHELGHVLSLKHSGNFGVFPNYPTMANNYDYGQSYARSLEAYDRSHEQNLYPPGSC